MYEILLVNIILLIGACAQSVVGYGVSLIAAPLLFLINPAYVPVVMILNSLLLTVLMVHRDHLSLSLQEVRWQVSGAFVGIVIAGAVLHFISGEQFEIVFGLLILFAVGLSVLGWHPKINLTNCLIAGGISGFMGTCTSIGGPAIALLYQKAQPDHLRANLSAFFLFNSIVGLFVLWLAGLVSLEHFQLFLHCIPGILLGFYLARVIQPRIAGYSLSPAILLIATLGGISTLVKGLV